MSNQEFVNFFDEKVENMHLPTYLKKELKVVQEIRNTTPTEKVNGQYVASPTNKAINQYRELTIRLIGSMVDQGLSYANGDYYVFVQFGGKPSVKKSPNGMIRAMNELASKSGYLADINTGCIFDGYEELKIVRDGHIDTLHLVNSSDAEVDNAAIVAPYAVVTLINKQTGSIISRKVTIVRHGEYEAAKDQGGYTHKTYPVPMAEKIALRRAADRMAAGLGIAESAELASLKSEIADHDSGYKKPDEKQQGTIKMTAAEIIEELDKARSVDALVEIYKSLTGSVSMLGEDEQQKVIDHCKNIKEILANEEAEANTAGE